MCGKGACAGALVQVVSCRLRLWVSLLFVQTGVKHGFSVDESKGVRVSLELVNIHFQSLTALTSLAQLLADLV